FRFDEAAGIFPNRGFGGQLPCRRRPRECGGIEIAADHDRLPRRELIDGIEQASHLLGSQRRTAMAFEVGAHEENAPGANYNRRSDSASSADPAFAMLPVEPVAVRLQTNECRRFQAET